MLSGVASWFFLFYIINFNVVTCNVREVWEDARSMPAYHSSLCRQLVGVQSTRLPRSSSSLSSGVTIVALFASTSDMNESSCFSSASQAA